MREDVKRLTADYESALKRKGIVPEGVFWPNAVDLGTRFEVQLAEAGILSATPSNPLRLLDFGCGPGFLLDYLNENGLLDRVQYTGVDVVESTIAVARSRWPEQRFDCRDVRDEPYPAESFDACVICGVFTGRPGNDYDEMVSFVRSTLASLWSSVTLRLVFNVMSKHVDWERDDLFHWPLDEAMSVCKAEMSRHVRMRLDYGLWEATLTVARFPMQPSGRVPASWFRS